MVAANPEMSAETPAALALKMTAQMSDMVERGDWMDVETQTVRLRKIVLQIPESDRRRVILEIQRVTDMAAAAAEDAHRDVSGKLSALRRGQAATEAYQSS